MGIWEGAEHNSQDGKCPGFRVNVLALLGQIPRDFSMIDGELFVY